MKPGRSQPPTTEAAAAETARAEGFARKQKWKEQPGNRYTPEELRKMSGEFADCTLHKRRTKVMFVE